MAKNTSLVLLGYDDEQISEKHISLVDYTTNKIGGKPVSSLQSCNAFSIQFANRNNR